MHLLDTCLQPLLYLKWTVPGLHGWPTIKEIALVSSETHSFRVKDQGRQEVSESHTGRDGWQKKAPRTPVPADEFRNKPSEMADIQETVYFLAVRSFQLLVPTVLDTFQMDSISG